MQNPTPKYRLGQTLVTARGNQGKVMEITLLRRENSIAYGLSGIDLNGNLAYVPEDQIKGIA